MAGGEYRRRAELIWPHRSVIGDGRFALCTDCWPILVEGETRWKFAAEELSVPEPIPPVARLFETRKEAEAEVSILDQIHKAGYHCREGHEVTRIG